MIQDTNSPPLSPTYLEVKTKVIERLLLLILKSCIVFEKNSDLSFSPIARKNTSHFPISGAAQFIYYFLNSKQEE